MTGRDEEKGHAAPVVELRGVTKAFRGHLGIGRTVAVNGLDLRVEPGEIFGLLGPNGAGKTTTIKMIVGLLRPDLGMVRLFGRSPSDPTARRNMGFLPENPYFYDYLTGTEFLDFYGRLRGMTRAERKARVPAVLERVGLEGKQNRPLRKYSKGMVQRLGLAQAILTDPELVILDEPMSGLDPVGRREIRDLILSLRAAGGTVFFSSHILQDAELICDRVAIVVEGRLRSAGRLADLVSRRVRWFEVSVSGALPDVGGATPLTASLNGETLVRVDDVDALGAYLAAVRASGGRVTAVWPRRETLEDLFLREVRRPGASGGSP